MSNTNKDHIALSMHNLSVGYKAKKEGLVVLEGLNLKLNPGELVCFMGPNGVGKSTLLRTIAGVQKPLAGNIKIEAKDQEELSTFELAASISLVLTDKINAGNMTGRELVSLGRYPYIGWSLSFEKKDLEKIEQAIHDAQVEPYADKLIHELSDGQLQKMMIARALCQDTPIMILDEPTAHLDLNNRVSVINLLKNLTRKTGKAVLIATHELDLALQSADRLWLAGYNSPVISGFPEDMVLNGAIDKVFELKGYDLRTGELKKKSLGKQVRLQGSGHEYLWTKNALERNGYEIAPEGKYNIKITAATGALNWTVEGNDTIVTNTLEELIKYLNQQF